MSIPIDAIEKSFAAIAPRAPELALRFYDRLFREHPEVAPLFTSPMSEQRKKLLASLGAIVGGLRDPEQLRQYARALAIRHVAYGAARAHYPVVGQVLIKTLADMAGKSWTPQLEQAWTQAYQAIQAIIFEALDESDAASAAA